MIVLCYNNTMLPSEPIDRSERRPDGVDAVPATDHEADRLDDSTVLGKAVTSIIRAFPGSWVIDVNTSGAAEGDEALVTERLQTDQ